MFVLFKKSIVVETSSEEITRIATVLEQNNVPFELRTRRERGFFGTFFDAQSYARANISMYKGASQPLFVYMVFVKKSDVSRARDLLFGNEIEQQSN